MFWIKLVIAVLFQVTCQYQSLAAVRFVVSECYGRVLSLSCSPGQKIRVVNDFYGVSSIVDGEIKCGFTEGDCTVQNNRFTSVIHRYCEGQQTCTSFQVDRRSCDENSYTSYEQIEYECVSESQTVNICESVNYETHIGYLSTPNFPGEYPPNLDCQCILKGSDSSTFIKLEATHFIIKYDHPCKDWLEIDTGRSSKRLCGAYSSTLVSPYFKLAFHSNNEDGHQGVWLRFSMDTVKHSTSSIFVECGHFKPSIPQTAKTRSFQQVTSLPWKQPTLVYENYETILQTAMTPSGIKDTKYSPIFITPENSEIKPNENEDTYSIEIEQNKIIKANITKYLPRFSKYPPTTLARTNTFSPFTTKHISYTGLSKQNEVAQNSPPWKPTSSPASIGQRNEEQRKNHQITGFTTIAVCVGVVIILITAVTVIFGWRKRKKKPRRQIERRKQREQQRLNSLSFYDSIPLYDSIGRRGGVPRAPPLPQSANSSSGSHIQLQPLDPCNFDAWKAEAPYWTQIPEDVEPENVIYAELDRFTPGPSTSTQRLSKQGMKTIRHSQNKSKKVNANHDLQLALCLKSLDNLEEVYTHV